jgi:hypothetical protein
MTSSLAWLASLSTSIEEFELIRLGQLLPAYPTPSRTPGNALLLDHCSLPANHAFSRALC